MVKVKVGVSAEAMGLGMVAYDMLNSPIILCLCDSVMLTVTNSWTNHLLSLIIWAYSMAYKHYIHCNYLAKHDYIKGKENHYARLCLQISDLCVLFNTSDSDFKIYSALACSFKLSISMIQTSLLMQSNFLAQISYLLFCLKMLTIIMLLHKGGYDYTHHHLVYLPTKRSQFTIVKYMSRNWIVNLCLRF